MHKPNLSKYEDGSQVYLVYASIFDVESSKKNQRDVNHVNLWNTDTE